MKSSILVFALLTTASLNSFAQDAQIQVENPNAPEATTEANDTPVAPNEKKGLVVSGSIGIQSRYMQVNAKNKQMMQYNVTLMGTIDLFGKVQILGLAQTGNAYNLAYNNIYNFKNHESFEDQHLKLRRLYLEKQIKEGKIVLDFGAMGNRPSIARAGKLSDLGWIDGARAKFKTSDKGTITITGGSLNSVEPSLIERAKNLKLNYFEITVSQQVFKGMLIEGGVEILNDETFLEAATKNDLEIASGRVISFVSDIIVNTKTGGVKFGAGVDNLLALFTGKFPDVKLSAAYMYTSANIGARGQLTNTFTALGAKGHAAVLSMQAPISKKNEFSTFATATLTGKGERNIYEFGIKKTININKAKKPIRIFN